MQLILFKRIWLCKIFQVNQIIQSIVVIDESIIARFPTFFISNLKIKFDFRLRFHTQISKYINYESTVNQMQSQLCNELVKSTRVEVSINSWRANFVAHYICFFSSYRISLQSVCVGERAATWADSQLHYLNSFETSFLCSCTKRLWGVYWLLSNLCRLSLLLELEIWCRYFFDIKFLASGSISNWAILYLLQYNIAIKAFDFVFGL